MKKRIISFLLIFVVTFQLSAFASVLGNLTYSEYAPIASGVTFNKNQFMSTQVGVGQQTEYYLDYSPNNSVIPMITNGEFVYGRQDINQTYSYLKSQGVNPVAGINGDFFSLTTGVPIGHVIENGKITSFSSDTQPTVGFRSDGSAFISDLALTCNLSIGGQNIAIPEFNKYLQPYEYYLYDSNFGTTLNSDATAVNAVFQIMSGTSIVGGNVNAKLIKIEQNSNEPIPSNCFVLSVDLSAPQDLVTTMQNLEVGQTATFSFGSNDNATWQKADFALGTTAGEIVQNGAWTGTDVVPGAFPRTAIGIKANGDVVFYAIDGRETGVSYGVQTKTLAQRMIELGCVSALNLDGGGSTTIGSIKAGFTDFAVNNNPSDGSPRQDGTFLFLVNKTQPTGVLAKLFAYPNEQTALVGSNVSFDVKGTDENYYAVDTSNLPIQGAKVYVTKEGEQDVPISYGDITTTAKVIGITSPSSISAILRDTREDISTLSVKNGDKIGLDFAASLNGSAIVADESAFNVSVDSNLGYWDAPSGDLVITANGYAQGNVTISAGSTTKTIKVTANAMPFVDAGGLWATDYIQKIYDLGLANGYTENGKSYYKPLNTITRAEFITMVGRGLNLDAPTTTTKFGDGSAIGSWAINYVQSMFALGYVKGDIIKGKVMVRPNDPITRAETVTIIGRIFTKYSAQATLNYTDKSQIPSWSKDYFATLTKAGIISGYDDGSLKPLGNITRAETAKILALVFE